VKRGISFVAMVGDRIFFSQQAIVDKPSWLYSWNIQISYCINASIVGLTMLGRRACELALRGLRDSQYGQLQ